MFDIHLAVVYNKFVVKNPPHLRCVTTLPCDLVLITITYFRLLASFWH